MEQDRLRRKPDSLDAAIAKVQNKIARDPKYRGKTISIDLTGRVRIVSNGYSIPPGRIEKVYTHRTFTRFSHCTQCGEAFRARLNEYGRNEPLCPACLARYRILENRKIFQSHPTIGSAVKEILRASTLPLDETLKDISILWTTKDTCILNTELRIILYKGSIAGPVETRHRQAYEEDSRYYYYRCWGIDCQSIQRTPKRSFVKPPGSGIAIDPRRHCRTCSKCQRHSYISFETSRKRSEAPRIILPG